MPNVAARERARVLAEMPGASVRARGRNFLEFDTGVPGQRRWVGITGPGVTMPDGITDIDTAWEADPDVVWDWRARTVEGRSVQVHTRFDVAENVKWTDTASGESIVLQSLSLAWSNDLDQLQPVADPQNVNGAPGTGDEDARFFWPSAYGAGRDFEWINHPQKLVKNLILNSAAALPAYTLGGTGACLQLHIRFGMSSGVEIWVNGALWYAGQGNPPNVDTSGAVEFRRKTTGEVLWQFDPPMARDDDATEQLSVFRLKRQGPNLNIFIRVPKAWLDSATYPVRVDTDINKVVGASTDDAHEGQDGLNYSHNANWIDLFNRGSVSWNKDGGFRFTGISGLSGATIDSASYSQWTYNNDAQDTRIYAEESAAPATFSSSDTPFDRTVTTAYVEWIATLTKEQYNSLTITSVIQEIADTYDPSAIVIISRPLTGTAYKTYRCRSYDYSASEAAKLDITYTAAGGGVDVTPAAGSLSLTGQAPSVTAPFNATPAAGSLALTGNAPTVDVSANVDVTPAAGSLSLTGQAPSVTAPFNATPAAGSLALTGNAPSVSAPFDATPAASALSLTGYAPSVQLPVDVTPAAGSLTLTGQAPSVQLPVNVTPGAGSLALTGNAPTVTGLTTEVTPAASTLTLTGYAPIVSTSEDVNVTPAAGSLTLTGYAPSVSAPFDATPAAGSLALTGYAPSVQLPVDVTPDAGSLTLTGYAPSVELPIDVTPAAGTLTVTGQAASVELPVNVTPAAGSLTLTGYAPTVGVPIDITPSSGSLTLTGNAPSVQLPVDVTPAAGSLALTGNAPSVELPVSATPAAGSLTLTGYAPTVTGLTTVITPAAGSLTLTGQEPTVTVPTEDAEPVTPPQAAGQVQFVPRPPEDIILAWLRPQPATLTLTAYLELSIETLVALAAMRVSVSAQAGVSAERAVSTRAARVSVTGTAEVGPVPMGVEILELEASVHADARRDRIMAEDEALIASFLRWRNR